MFCTIKKRDNKNKEKTYNIYLSERTRVDGKIKSSDTFILSLSCSDIKSDHYKDIVKNNVDDDNYNMIIEKLDKYIKQNKGDFIDCSGTNLDNYKEEVIEETKKKYETIHKNVMHKYNVSADDMSKTISKLTTKNDELKAELFTKNNQLTDAEFEIKRLNIEILKLESELKYEQSRRKHENTKLEYVYVQGSKLNKSDYRKLAKVCHPDNGGSEELMNIISKLYENK